MENKAPLKQSFKMPFAGDKRIQAAAAVGAVAVTYWYVASGNKKEVAGSLGAEAAAGEKVKKHDELVRRVTRSVNDSVSLG